MARRNPTISKVAPANTVIDGIDNLPNPIGVNMKAVADAEKMPGHGSVSAATMSMKPNDGDNPSVASAPFANGRDLRVFTGGGSKSDPTPAMPGA